MRSLGNFLKRLLTFAVVWGVSVLLLGTLARVTWALFMSGFTNQWVPLW